MSEIMKSIAIKESTYNRLAERGNLKDSYDSVISKLLDKEQTAQ